MKLGFRNTLILLIVILGVSACGNAVKTEAIKEEINHYMIDGKEVTEEEYYEAIESKEQLTAEEKFAVDYLLAFSHFIKNPHSLNLYHVWVYIKDISGSKKWYYVTYEYSASNDVGGTLENIMGNSLCILVDEAKGDILEDKINEASLLRLDDNKENKYFTPSGTEAKKKGIEVDANKVLEYYMDNL